MANLNFPLFQNSIADAPGWVNQITRSLTGALYSPIERVTALPSPTLDRVFLLGVGVVAPLVSGDILVYTTTSAAGYQTYTPIDGTVVGGYTRKTTLGVANWVQTEFADGAIYRVTASGSVAVPTTFRGICTIVIPAGLTATFTTTLMVGGVMGTLVSSGIYFLFQDGVNSILSGGATGGGGGGGGGSAATLVYGTDGDPNGMFYWLGTAYGTQSWVNPIGGSLLGGLASTTALGSITMLSDRINSNFYTDPVPNQWVAWDLKSGHNIAVSAYTLRARNVAPDHLLRNWVLEGTNTVSAFDVAGLNGASWTAIDTRSADTTLAANSQYYTLMVNGSTAPYQYLRLRQTGLNSTSSNYLTLGKIEFYGSYV
jgi:hypothetical protein